MAVSLPARWRRETRIKAVAGRPQGEVAYYAPCGKKLRQYPDVMKVPRPPLPQKGCTVASNAQSRYRSKCFEMFASRAVFQ